MKLKIIFSLCIFSLLSSLFAQNQRERERFYFNCGPFHQTNNTDSAEDPFHDLTGFANVATTQTVLVNGIVFEVEDLPDDEDSDEYSSDDSMDVEVAADDEPAFTRQETLYRIHYNRYLQRAWGALGNGFANLRNYLEDGVVTDRLRPLATLAVQEGDAFGQIVENANLDTIESRVEEEINASQWGGEDLQYPEHVTVQEYLGMLQQVAQHIRSVLGNNVNIADPMERRISRLVWATAFVHLYMDIQAFIQRYPAFSGVMTIAQMRSLAHGCNASVVATMYALLRSTPRVFMTIRVLSPEGTRNIFVDNSQFAAGRGTGGRARMISLNSLVNQNNTQADI